MLNVPLPPHNIIVNQPPIISQEALDTVYPQRYSLDDVRIIELVTAWEEQQQ